MSYDRPAPSSAASVTKGPQAVRIRPGRGGLRRAGSPPGQLLAFALLALLLPAATGAQNVAPLGYSKGDTLPDATLYDASGKPATFSDFRGRVLVVAFFAEWCPPCWAKMDSLLRLQEMIASDDRIATIIVGHREPEQRTRDALAREGITIPAYHTRQTGKNRYVNWGGVKARLATSESYVLDHRGVILVQKSTDGRDFDELAEFLHEAASKIPGSS